MNLNEYQSSATKFAANDLEPKTALAVWGLGLAGESGEVVELIKKHLGHGHELDLEKVSKELGDVLWYISAIAKDSFGINLPDC